MQSSGTVGALGEHRGPIGPCERGGGGHGQLTVLVSDTETVNCRRGLRRARCL